ncbi:hypothetical protein KCP77_19190 [Salmonella enterica subsp. enterica]|nr:hypothetical protein KCP77_19190 [Salmonella enterica subsp. enterica]
MKNFSASGRMRHGEKARALLLKVLPCLISATSPCYILKNSLFQTLRGGVRR